MFGNGLSITCFGNIAANIKIITNGITPPIDTNTYIIDSNSLYIVSYDNKYIVESYS